MATPAEIQTLLRFLSQSASIPLARAMALIPQLQKAQLTTIAAIAAHPVSELHTLLFPDDEKAAKQLHNAAKRAAGVSAAGKRKNDASAAQDGLASTPGSARKRRRKSPTASEPTPAEIEADLALPEAQGFDEELLRSTMLYTNRAPLLLAFAVTLLKYTMSEQPLSSRLSLAQAMVSTGARARAYDLGIEQSKSAEDEGWGKGQPVVRVVGREIKVLKRWGYEVGGAGDAKAAAEQSIEGAGESNAVNADQEGDVDAGAPNKDVKLANNESIPNEPPLWGLDLEALKKFNAPPLVNAPSYSTSGLPIHRPEAARAYLLKSFATAGDNVAAASAAPSKAKPKQVAEEKERNLGLLLAALDMLYQSWATTLTADEMDRRAWSWYVAVRPGVEEGAAGWGGKNQVKLSQILDLRKQA